MTNLTQENTEGTTPSQKEQPVSDQPMSCADFAAVLDSVTEPLSSKVIITEGEAMDI